MHNRHLDERAPIKHEHRSNQKHDARRGRWVRAKRSRPPVNWRFVGAVLGCLLALALLVGGRNLVVRHQQKQAQQRRLATPAPVTPPPKKKAAPPPAPAATDQDRLALIPPRDEAVSQEIVGRYRGTGQSGKREWPVQLSLAPDGTFSLSEITAYAVGGRELHGPWQVTQQNRALQLEGLGTLLITAYGRTLVLESLGPSPTTYRLRRE